MKRIYNTQKLGGGCLTIVYLVYTSIQTELVETQGV